MPASDEYEGAGKIASLLGLLGGTAAIAVGGIFLVFALPSIGRPGEFDYLFSQAAGGFLIILLGLLGIYASVLAWPGQRMERAALFIGALSYLFIFILFSIYQEWRACAVVLIMIVAACLALRRRQDASRLLYLFAGLFGFALTQASITLLPYGWKAWSVSGVLFLFGAVLLSLSRHLCRFPLLSRPASRRLGLLIYSFLALVLIAFTVAALVHLPGPAGPGTAEILAQAVTDQNSSSGQGEIKECACPDESSPDQNSATQNDSDSSGQEDAGFSQAPECPPEEGFQAVILSPGDVRAFSRGEGLNFTAHSCPGEECSYLWRSSRDGIIGTDRSLQRDDLSAGWHNISLTVTNSSGSWKKAYVEIAIAEPWVCSKVNPKPKYYPPDTPCRDVWPNATEQCQVVEVCHPGLDWIVAEAVDCCDGSPRPGRACSDACNRSGGNRKKCRGVYLINSFGPEARYMKGYALFKACCSGYPECTRMCGSSLNGKQVFLEGYNENVSHLSCRPEEKGLQAWHSDTNMSENSATMGLIPTHATINILQTGVCSDYAAALTTMLRKAGYNQSEALMTISMAFDLPLVGDHPGHAFNLVLLPGDDRYHIVDTTGNGDGINLGGLPGYFQFTGCFLGMPSHTRIMDWWTGYCKMISKHSSNDAGYYMTPDKEKICGCSQNESWDKWNGSSWASSLADIGPKRSH